MQPHSALNPFRLSRPAARRAALLLGALAVASTTMLACATGEAEDDESGLVSDSDGDSASDELVSESQLNGRSLPDRTLVLTFDDGPGPRTRELAEYLKDEGITATFFMNGAKEPGREGQTQAVLDNGHIVGNHTQNHKQLTKLSASGIRTELQATDDIIEQYQPDGPWLLRAPYGAWNRNVSNAVNASDNLRKYTGSIFWDIGGATTSTTAADWECWGAKKYTVARCAALYLSEIRARRRGIVLMHDLHGKTVDMVKILVPSLKQQGYRFVNLPQVPAIATALGEAVDLGERCQSATLGRRVEPGVCVQSANNGKWNLCSAGDWSVVDASAAECTERYSLP